MTKRPLVEAIGQTVTHKRLGPCLVHTIVAEPEGKVRVKVIASNEDKVVIFSPQFFEGVEEFQTVDVAVKPKRPQKKVHKEVDLSKYRNHPLVKEIDAKEKGYHPRELYNALIEEETEEPLLTEEDDE